MSARMHRPKVLTLFVFCMWCATEIHLTHSQGTCTYHGLCLKRTPGQGRLSFEVCLKEQSCVETYGHWSACTKSCGCGVRTRHGKCYGTKCKEPIEQTEACNTQACGTPRPPEGPLSTMTPPSLFSCSGVSFGTTFKDPDLECSASFYICVGGALASKLECPGRYVWSQVNVACQASCDA